MLAYIQIRDSSIVLIMIPNQKESNIQSQQFIPRRKRRPRDDPMERNYICVCGKRYLSYPALYTHIKNKHQGKAPSPGEAGLPRIGETKSMMVTREQPQNQHEKHLSTPDEALVYVINTFKPYSPTKQLNYTVEQIFRNLPQQLKKDIQERTRISLEQKVQVQKILDNGIKAVTIDEIMGKFLSLLVNKIDKALLQQFVFILLMFRKYLNRYNAKEDNPLKQYTKEVSGMKMLDNANEFTLYYFDIVAKPYRRFLEDTCFISRPKREFICLTKFMFLFGRWAFLDRYTNSKIRLNNF